MIISDKYRSFLRTPSKVDFLEGTTYAGKTTIGAIKFMLRIADNPRAYHILAGLDLGTLERNIITPAFGILDIFGEQTVYRASGGGGITLPHIRFSTPAGDKIIYTMGYDNRARFKKALGGQYGCVYIDEINIADIDFIREVAIRFDYLIGTLNPDDPSLTVYAEYINRSRPTAEWESETPQELLEQLDSDAAPGWIHWYFTFDHNAAITDDKRRQLLTGTAKDTKLYKNKILGLRGRSSGLVFDLQPGQIITAAQARQHKVLMYSCGVDTAYSRKSEDSFAFIFGGLTDKGTWITLAEETINNRDRAVPLTPSDIPARLTAFLERCRETWGFSRGVFIDSADQATILEAQKYKRDKGSIYSFGAAWKQTQIIDRINLQAGWMASGDYLILDSCAESIRELNAYSWQEDRDAPEDRNDHTINAAQYAWLPYKTRIGAQNR